MVVYELGPRAERVYLALLDRIRSGQLAPGRRLPAHTQLAASFGVAPLTVRQVLARLEAERLVVRERGRGTFVRAAERTGGLPVLVVTADPVRWADLERQVRTAGNRPVLAATPAEAVAALQREAPPSMALVDLQLPRASAGLRLVRRLRQLVPELPIAILNPTRGQRTRLEHTVAPPLLIVGAGPLDAALQLFGADTRPPDRLKPLVERYVAMQVAGDRAAARSLMHAGLAAGLTIADLYVGVLEPAQYRIGQLWQENRINVAREHLATAVTQDVLVDLAASASHLPDRGMRVLVGCVEGELHDIGARMLADLLDLDGFTVRFLGADVPTESLLAIVREESPRLLILSAAMPERLEELRAAVARVRAAYGRGLSVFVGGQIMDWAPQAVGALDVELATRNVLETLSAARQLTSARR